jgi:hypothetical protein
MAAWAQQLPPSRRALRCRRAGSPPRQVPGGPARRRRAGRPVQHRRGRCGAGLVRRHRQVPGPARPGGPDRDPAPQVAGPAAGRAGPRAGRGGQPGKRPMCRECYTPAGGASTASGDGSSVAVVRMAGMTLVVVPADLAACPALPSQASIERRIADSERLRGGVGCGREGARISRFGMGLRLRGHGHVGGLGDDAVSSRSHRPGPRMPDPYPLRLGDRPGRLCAAMAIRSPWAQTRCVAGGLPWVVPRRHPRRVVRSS